MENTCPVRCSDVGDQYVGHSTVEFSEHETEILTDLYDKLAVLRDFEIQLPEDGVWQLNQDGSVKTAYLAVPHRQYKTWSTYLETPETAPVSEFNPLCCPALFGPNLKEVLYGLPYGASEAYVFKIPMSLFGNDIGLMYNDNVQTGHFYLSDVFCSLPSVETLITTVPSRFSNYGEKSNAKIGNHVTRLQGAFTTFKRYQRDCRTTMKDMTTLSNFLWNQRHSALNQAISMANHHHETQGRRQMLIPVTNLKKVLANKKIPHAMACRSQLDLIGECGCFWPEEGETVNLRRSA